MHLKQFVPQLDLVLVDNVLHVHELVDHFVLPSTVVLTPVEMALHLHLVLVAR